MGVLFWGHCWGCALKIQERVRRLTFDRLTETKQKIRDTHGAGDSRAKRRAPVPEVTCLAEAIDWEVLRW